LFYFNTNIFRLIHLYTFWYKIVYRDKCFDVGKDFKQDLKQATLTSVNRRQTIFDVGKHLI